MDYLVLIQDLDKMIRSGQVKPALDKLVSLNYSKIPDRLRYRFANLAWRSGSPVVGLKILTPVVNSEKAQLREDVTAEELIEYCVLLQKVGSFSEAIEKLSFIDENKYPKCLLYKSFCYFSQWRYHEAAPLLEKYIESPLISQYDRLVGSINFLAALVSIGDLDRAEKVKTKLINVTQADEYNKLRGNLYELDTQIQVRRGDLEAAKTSILRSREILSKDSSSDAIYVMKWLAIIESLQKNSQDPLIQFRARALSAKSWESLREIDLYRLQIHWEQGRFQRLIYGTPFKEYQNRALKILSHSDSLPSRVQVGRGPTLDLYYGELDGKSIINQGKKIHQLVYFLASDLYRPQSIGAIFSSLFSEENFDIYSSPNKIHQLVDRTRKWIQKADIPMDIEESLGFYKLNISRQFSLTLDLEKSLPSKEAILWKQLSQKVHQDIVSRQDIMDALSLSLTPCQRFLQYCLTQGLLTRMGSGKNTQYQIKKSYISKAS
ncbi:MAG: hypothetical protein KDD33_05260 [Bdellovibrionales bacterium]|nr:hypothetical protein [Bdellovibrionales bacterium]